MATNPISQTLLTILDNQVSRTEAVFEGLTDEVFGAEPGGQCNSILRIGRHLVGLRRFQLTLLGQPNDGKVDPESISTISEMLAALHQGEASVRQAIVSHDSGDWFTKPEPPRPGRWGDEPTICRFVRPLNDFTNHLGAVRAIRRMMNCPAEQTQ